MTAFEITIKPPEEGAWGWKWHMTWYDPQAPLCMGFRDSVEVYPHRQAAKIAAEDYARRIAELVAETYTYEPRSAT